MDRFPIDDSDKTKVIFKNALEFIGAVRAGISWERFCVYAVQFSDAFIDILNETEEARKFLSSKGITTDYVQSNVKAIFARLHLNKGDDYYLTLALPRTATETQIHKRWKELMRIYHPDRNNDEDAALCAKRINEAYSILKNPDKKMAYDRKIGKTLESGFTHRRSKAIHADKLGQHPFISPEMRRRLPKLILASCTAVSCIVLLIMFLRNKLEIYTYQASALPEHYRQDTGQAYGTPGIGKGEPKETTIAGFQPAESQTQDTMTKTGALPEKSQKDRETEGLSVKAFNPPGTRTRSAGVTTLRISPSRAAQEKSMADAKSGIMEKPSREKTDDPSLNNMVRTASPDQNIQNIKKDISPASLQKKPSPEQVDVSGEITNPSPPVSVPKDNHPNLETEVFLFMSQYITAYEEGDITRFMDLFSKSAVENNRLQYADIMRFYQKNFEGGRYTYTLKNLRLQKGEDRVIVSGHYSIRKMTDNDTGLKKDGMIQWTLAKENGNFKIVKIDYDTK